MMIVQIITFIFALVALILAAKKNKRGPAGSDGTCIASNCDAVAKGNPGAPGTCPANCSAGGGGIPKCPLSGKATEVCITPSGGLQVPGTATIGKQVNILGTEGLVLQKGSIAVESDDAYITVGNADMSLLRYEGYLYKW